MAKSRRSPVKTKSAKSMTKKKLSSSASAAKTVRPSARRPTAATKPTKAAPKTVKGVAAASAGSKKASGKVQGKTAAKARPAAPPPLVRTRPAPPPPTPRRSTYADAVATYDRGMQAFHQRRFAEAQEILGSIVTLYPEEKELHERIQMYLNVCARHAAPRDTQPQTMEERLNSATLAINNGRPDEALVILRAVASEEPLNDSAAYLLGVAYTLKQDFPSAMAHLERAISLNPENRDLIRKEADLEALRHTDQFEELLTAQSSSRKRRT